MNEGKEQFRNMITRFKNRHLIAAMLPLVQMRMELTADDEIQLRTGMDNTSRNHYMMHLANCDRYRRAFTYNPENADLNVLIPEAIDIEKKMGPVQNPIAGENIQHGTRSEADLPWLFDGTDVDIPLMTQLKHRAKISPSGLLLLGGIDDALVEFTRRESRKRSHFITMTDSYRMFEMYAAIKGFLAMFQGDAHFVDFAQVLPSEEPTGADNAPNRVTERDETNFRDTNQLRDISRTNPSGGAPGAAAEIGRRQEEGGGSRL